MREKKTNRTIFKRPADGTVEVSSVFFILPEIENIAQKVLLLICIYRRLELGVGRNNLVRLKGRRRLR